MTEKRNYWLYERNDIRCEMQFDSDQQWQLFTGIHYGEVQPPITLILWIAKESFRKTAAEKRMNIPEYHLWKTAEWIKHEVHS